MGLYFIGYMVISMSFLFGIMFDSYIGDRKMVKEMEIKYNLKEEMIDG